MTDQADLKVAPFPSGEDEVPVPAGAEVARVGDPVAVWPCAGCGRPVPQPVRGARTVRYCQEDGGACERAARDRRDQGRQAPGLTGQVAWTWEMVERLEQVADQLAGSLTSELSVAGVERRVSAVRAEATAEVAVAQGERDASQRQAEAAWREVAAARARADAAEQDVERMRAEAAEAVAARDQAQARLHECEQRNWRLARTAEEMRAALHALTAERDAARTEAERARRRVDALTQAGGRPAAGRWPDAEPEPPTGLHSLNGFPLPHAG
ncbi:hypothetical protein [Actinomadura hibisca]|uniref:hypothetical protein n=1 Tax=Actinomadura hibisca TaxID=68565 RepID=UPI00082E14C0|nr:hypothetical protein [Actinomadura hibisca]